MAERQKRRRFTTEFKAQAAKRLLDGGKGLGEVATELGLSPGQLGAWRNEHLAAGSAEALAQRKAEQDEAQRLRREVKRLEEEVGILEKAAAFMGWPAPHSGDSIGSSAGKRSGADRCRRSRFSGSTWVRTRAASRAWTPAAPSCCAGGRARQGILALAERLPPCVVAMEACC